MKEVLITGSGGLIGSEACRFFSKLGFRVTGIDNNMRRYFFGKEGDTKANIKKLNKLLHFINYNFDLRDMEVLTDVFKEKKFDLIIHTAAQPSHDWAAKEPLVDFSVNATATLNLLECFRKFSPKGVFIFTSTNKVYGDNPNKVRLVEGRLRYDYSEKQNIEGVSSLGISESMSIDNCKHSLFGVSKASADLLCQEYGKYFGLKIGVFRGGCLTGPQHSAVRLHGFLTYIIDCAVNDKHYSVLGYNGKQVRDQIHSYDVVNAFHHFYQNPKEGEVYNLGGCYENSTSILEIINILKKKGYKLRYKILPTERIGDHICYYSDMRKFKRDYPKWEITKSLGNMIDEIIKAKKR